MNKQINEKYLKPLFETASSFSELGNGFSNDTFLKLPYIKPLEDGYHNFENFYKDQMHMTRRYRLKETSLILLHLPA